eukprot:COSAG02_NODE_47331_length_342_cov_0.625514_1_plen_68_part_00
MRHVEDVLVAQVTHAVRETIAVDAARHKDVEADSLVLVPADMPTNVIPELWLAAFTCDLRNCWVLGD